MAFQNWSLIFLCSVFILILNSQHTQGIRCFVCGKDSASNSTKICDKGTPVGSVSPVDCPEKISGKVIDACGYSITEESDGEVIRRTCVSSKIISDKVSIQGDPLELDRCYNDITVSVRGISVLTDYKIFCTCTTDECNLSRGHSIMRTTLDFFISFLLIFSVHIFN